MRYLSPTVGIADIVWRVTSLLGEDGRLAPVIETTTITVDFADEGMVSGTGARNRYIGPASLASPAIGPMATTS